MLHVTSITATTAILLLLLLLLLLLIIIIIIITIIIKTTIVLTTLPMSTTTTIITTITLEAASELSSRYVRKSRRPYGVPRPPPGSVAPRAGGPLNRPPEAEVV
ncbi:hypothetical protein VOLCADRAFT_93221 [Volvox carteri f. nagariensis]|uniref:Uncharacterized protein n=1 Tax=Volvox carteri f. nagariensis TaxID=3068 RepID=D8U1L5_VOLCA|nr:uncharacterized protein VOLCADRAFT_93221 [Volvox carteri f. nagariensis]EFJ46433.1 hypothetical protein VOLCADRAFT_93221 [Volvox carteri f. nagariensis]|eukprot:XP_002952586.1 hypothetical protein VOLCADRAFT_93221 [Volvox carteri f. nagariensis]